MQLKSSFRPFVMALASVMFVFACSKSDFGEVELPDHSSEYAFPLFSTNLNVSDILPNLLSDSLPGDTLVFNPDRTVSLIYSGEVAERKATDIFTTWFASGFAPVFDTLYYVPLELPDSLQLYEANLSGGSINFGIQNSTSDSLHGYLEIPQLTKNGEIFRIPFGVAATKLYVSPPNPLDGWVLTSSDNRLYFRYYAYKNDGTRVKVPDVVPGIFPGTYLVFDKMTFSYMEGFWGRQLYPLDANGIGIDINASTIQGDVKITNPKVTIIADNSFGFPTRGIIRHLRFKGRDGQILDLQSPYMDTTVGINFDYPKLSAGEVGQSKRTVFYFDNQNSNIADIFNSQPDTMFYKVDAYANVDNDPTLVGFLTDKSSIKFAVKVELTLEGSARDFAANDTLDLDFGTYENLSESEVESIEFKLVTENETPMGASLQLYFQDASGALVDSLFADGRHEAIGAAPVDADGRATDVKRVETFIPMDFDRFERIRTAEKAYFKAYFTTTDGGNVPVKILSDSNIRVKMGVKVKIKRGG